MMRWKTTLYIFPDLETCGVCPSSPSCCKHPNWKGDGYCDDDNKSATISKYLCLKYLRKCEDTYSISQKKYLHIYEDSFGAKMLTDDCTLAMMDVNMMVEIAVVMK